VLVPAFQGIANAVLPFVHLFNVHIFVQLIKYTQRPLHLLLQTKKYMIQFSIFAPINHCSVIKPLYVFSTTIYGINLRSLHYFRLGYYPENMNSE